MTAFATGALHELGDSMAIGARRALPAVRSKRLALAYDVRGDRVETAADPARVMSSLYRVMTALVDLMSVGALVIDARVSVSDRGRGRCEIRAGASGLLVSPQEISRVMLRLDLAEPAHSDEMIAGTRQGTGVCPATGSTLRFACRPGEGAVFHVAIDLPVVARHSPLDARGARVWIVDANGFSGDALATRLQRRGWATTRFDSLAAAERRLRGMPATHARPVLVIIAEAEQMDPTAVASVRSYLPASSRCVHLVTSGSPMLLRSTATDLRVDPLSPRDLDEFALLALAATSPSGLTSPAPLRWTERGRMLVVDDEPVNRILACQMGELLGYSTEAVASGQAALEHCARTPPDVVLMDLRMPALDGLETTRRLRALQLRGLMPPFPIVAATAEGETLHQPCEDAGMSAFLVKPLRMDALREALYRQCAGCIAEAA